MSSDTTRTASVELRQLAACIGTIRGLMGLPGEDIAGEHAERYSREIVAAVKDHVLIPRAELEEAAERIIHTGGFCGMSMTEAKDLASRLRQRSRG